MRASGRCCACCSPPPAPYSAVLGVDREAWQRHRDRLGSYGLDTPRGLSLFHSTLAEWLRDEAAGNYRIDPTDARKVLATTLWQDFEQADGRDRITWPEQVGTWLPELIHTLPQNDDPEALSRLGLFVQKSLWHYPEAEPLLQRVLAIFEKSLGPEHHDTSRSLNNLAGLYRAQGRYADAKPLYQRALAISEKTLGPEHPDVATSLNNLAGLYRAQGRLEEAEPVCQRVLAIREKALGPEHPDVATGLDNLAGLYDTQGRYAEAEPLFQCALAIKEKVLRPEHPDTATSLNNLAGLYRDQGRLEEAEPLFQRAVQIFVASLGMEHPHTQTAIDNLCATWKSRGLHEATIQARLRALLSSQPT